MDKKNNRLFKPAIFALIFMLFFTMFNFSSLTSAWAENGEEFLDAPLDEYYSDVYAEDLLPFEDFGPINEVFLKGKVISIIDETPLSADFFDARIHDLMRQQLQVEITDKPYQGQRKIVEHTASMTNPYQGVYLVPGDKVVIYGVLDQNNELQEIYIQDLVRERPIFLLAFLFVATLLVLGGLKGLGAIFTVILTGLLIWFGLLPAVLKGYNPLLGAIIVCMLVSILSTPMIAGFNRKSLSAVIGTISGVFIAGILAYYAGFQSRIVGIEFDYINLLLNIPNEVHLDLRGVFFAGVLIGSLGAVMDTGMSVASSMREIVAAHPKITFKELWKAGMNVGKDVMGMMSSTLILAYAGSALPLLLLMVAYETPALKLLNSDLIVSEIIRSLAGSIGLCLSIPITALVASYLLLKTKKS
ncbi:YibE/F family protein [Heliorestis acidaminivorans]|uniref:YibE/F family protein n=1 Tax=Heliorestis acidaminivorans TaxID=553427 RepID=A0A6I0ETH2_9FIRM|nr:YibE/F family protein [Heliorestis acidaminivorans]KAB2953935.1 YibE/F family protein [Heliorestis acidaminivorans]